MQIKKKTDRYLIWSGEATQLETKYFTPVRIADFQTLIIKFKAASEEIALSCTGEGTYSGSLITYYQGMMYLKAFQIAIVSDHFYIQYASEKVVGTNTLGALNTFKISAIYGVF